MRLKGKIFSEYETMDDFLRALGMSRSVFYRKSKEQSEFSGRQVKKIQELLHLSEDEVKEILL
jgi:hypothetical protein